MNNLIDGKTIAKAVQTKLTEKLQQLKQQGHSPGLAVVLVGDEPASAIYVRRKVRLCEEVGIRSMHCVLEEKTSQSDLLEKIHQLNQDASIHGILVQLPLPKHINTFEIIKAIDIYKDVDGFHPENFGCLAIGAPRFVPCTPLGVIHLLKSVAFSFEGANATMIGVSNIVGKPLALLLQQKGATVSLCHSKTRSLKQFTCTADLIITAAGKPNLLTAEMISPGCTIIDVGINRLGDGSLCGDVDFAGCAAKARWITPVPGGVGPMTLAMLLENTVLAAQYQSEKCSSLSIECPV